MLSPEEAVIKENIEKKGIKLKDWDVQVNYGIKTGYNDAFIIDDKTKDELIAKSPKNAEIIRPILRGRDIKRYTYDWTSLWLINSHNGSRSKNIGRVDVEKDYPNIFDYLQTFEKELIKRQDKGDHWTNLRNCAYLENFDKEKIIWIELTDPPNFTLDTNKHLLNNTIFFMTGEKLRYILAFLNSGLCEWYFDKIAATSGVGTRRWIKVYVEQIRIPVVCNEEEIILENIVDKILLGKAKNENTFKYEADIEERIYALFDLDPFEISIIKQGICKS